MNNCRLTLLSPKYLTNISALNELSQWLNVMRRPQGWHYDMDQTWMIENIEMAKLPKGSTILDAGAGLGIMQYVLAARGYNVVSLDFCKREVPKEAEGLFDLILENQDNFDYQHSYQQFIVHSADVVSQNSPTSFLNKLRASHLFSRLFYKTKREMLHRYYRARTKKYENSQYGKITFVRAAFHNIPFKENTFDALISVSALEHSDIGLLENNLSEMLRVVKPGAPVLISTSAIDDNKDFFDKKTQGWCYSSTTMSHFADNADSEYNKYKEVEQEILNSKLWRSRLDPYYFTDSESPFYRKQMTRLPYLPVGLLLSK